MAGTGDLLRRFVPCRAVIAHRNDWFVERVGSELRDRGIAVLARTDNGADAVGLAVSEQPDLMLVEDTLAMVPGEDVVRQLRGLSPETRIVAQAASADGVGPLLEAGACAVFTRRVPPIDVALAMHRLVAGSDAR